MHKGLLMVMASVMTWSLTLVTPLAAIDLPWEKDGAAAPQGTQQAEQDAQPAIPTGTKDIVVDELPQKPAVRAEDVRHDAIPIIGSPPPISGGESAAVLTDQEYLKMGMSAKDPQEQILYFSKAIQLNPGLYDAYYYRAVVYHANERFELAVADFSKALQIKPDSSVAYNNRGVAYHQMKQYDLAVGDFSKAIELNPDFGEAFNNRGVSRRSKGDIAGARKDYERAVQIDPTDEMAQMNLERVRRGKR